MARHGLGLTSAPAGLGFVRETNTGAAAAAAVPARAAPVGGGAQEPLDDIIAKVRANAGRPRRAPAAQPRAGRAPGIPQFKTDPIAALGFVLREVGAGLQGRELPSARIAKEERERETFELRRFQVGLDAVDQFSKLSGTQRAAAAAGFNARFGEFLGIDFSTLSATIEIDDVIPIVKGIDPSLLTAFADDPEKLRDVALDPQRRAILEEISDGRNLRPAMRKVLAGIEAVSGKLTEQDRGALGDRRFTFQDISQLAEPLGLTGPELAALDRNQATALPQLSEATGLQFTSEGILQKEAELVSLDRVRDEAAQRQADREVVTALKKQRALAPGASEREKDRAELEVATALRKQKLLAPRRVKEAGDTAKSKAEGKAAGTPPERTTNLVDFQSGKAVLKTSASSSVRGAVATLFGGTFDPITETIKGLDKDSSRRALAVQVEAERLLLNQIEVTPAAAVQSALKTIEARGAEGGGLPSPEEIQGMEVDEVRRLVESLPPETEISQELADAIKRKLKVK